MIRWAKLLWVVLTLWKTDPTLCVFGAEVRVRWDLPTNNVDGSALTDLAGCRIYWGTASRVYPSSTNLPCRADVAYGYRQYLGLSTLPYCPTGTVVRGLREGRTYYFSGTAYNSISNDSDYSEELIVLMPDVTPPVVRGPSSLTLHASASLRAARCPDMRGILTASDNVTPSGSLAWSQTVPVGSLLAPGTYTVTALVRDQANNVTRHDVAITVLRWKPKPPRVWTY